MDAVVGFAVATGVMSVMAHGAVDYLFHNSPQFAALFFLLLACCGPMKSNARTMESSQPSSS